MALLALGAAGGCATTTPPAGGTTPQPWHYDAPALPGAGKGGAP